jgi:hypothetical protein
MTSLDILLAVAGGIVTLLVIAGMILITPRENVEIYDDATESQGAELSRAGVSRGTGRDPRPAERRRPRTQPTRPGYANRHE